MRCTHYKYLLFIYYHENINCVISNNYTLATGTRSQLTHNNCHCQNTYVYYTCLFNHSLKVNFLLCENAL